MSFVHGAWLWLLPVLLPALVLLHSRRRRDVVVPNLLIWRKVSADGLNAPSVRAVPWRDPLLWLQLAALSLLVLALARPILGAGLGPSDWVAVVDASVAMSAGDVSPDRISEVRADIDARFARGDGSTIVSVVRAGTPATIIAARWPAGPDLTRVTSDLASGDGRADWRGAALRADLLAGDDSRVLVYTGPHGVEAARSALGEVGLADRVEYVVVGDDLVNVGIEDVNAVARGERPDQWAVTGRVTTSGLQDGDVIRVIASYRSTGTETFLPWGGTDVVLSSDGSANFEMPLDLPGPGELRLEGPTGDHVPADDSVVVPLRPEPVRVAVVGDAPPALLRALAAVGGLEVYAARSVPPPAQARLFDLVIVAEDLPGVPATSTLWLGVVPEAIRDGGPIDLSGRRLDAGLHRLVRDLETGALVDGIAQPIVTLEGTTPLLTSGDLVLAWARTTTSGRQVVMGIDPVSSAWQSQLSFPAFVADAVDWAAQRTWSHSPSGCTAHQACPWPREAYAADWVLLDPAGEEVALPVTPRTVPSDPLADSVWDPGWFDQGFTPDMSGVYRLRAPTGDVMLPVVSAPLEPAEPGARVPTPAPPASASAVWPWLAVLAVAVILVEAGLAVARREVALTRSRRQGAFLIAAVALLSLAVLGARVPTARYGGSATWLETESGGGAFTRVRADNPGRSWSRVEVVGVPHAAEGRGDALTTPNAALALEVALAMSPPGGDSAVVTELAPSSTIAEGTAYQLWRRAHATDTPVHLVETTLPPEEPPVGEPPSIASVTWPERIRSGAGFSVELQVEAPPGVAWTALLAAIDGSEVAAGAQAGAVEVTGTGPSSAALDVTAGPPGDATYRLTLTPMGEAEPAFEGLITVAVGPPVTALLVATDERQGTALEAALETQRVDVTRTTPLRMPGKAEDLAAYDAVLLVNVSANALFPEYQAALETYVRERGGGLAIFGGATSFGPGGYYTTPLEAVSPLSARISDDAPEVAIAFVLDRSGSMSGPVGDATRMDVAKAATVEALALLGEKSLAAIVVFDTAAQVVLPFTPVVETQLFRDALAGVGAAGGTAIYPGLVAAFGLLSENDSATRHVVVMTDGLSQEGDFEGVLTALSEMGVSVSFVGVGNGADGRQLNKLAGMSGGSLHMARDFRALPGLLAQEALMLAAEPIEERTTSARWVDDEPVAFLEDVMGDALPVLHGYVRTTPKDEASVHLVEDERGDPLIASWRYGLGRVVAFASAADGPWSEEWEEADFYGRLWAQALRWTAEQPLRDVWSMRTVGGDGFLDVVVEVPLQVDEPDLPPVELSVDGEVVRRGQLKMQGAATATARFTMAQDWVGALVVTVLPVPELGLSQPVVRSVSWPLPPSPQSSPQGVALADLAVATGGSVGQRVDLPNVTPRLVWRPVPSAWLLLGLASLITALALRYGAAVVIFGSLKAARRARTRTASLAR